jgi:glycosyltransferase involved in cell wall biosynthesis
VIGMRIHLIGLPHTQTTQRFNQCAYTSKARRFASMMHHRGHDVFLYASEQNDATCTELVTCITRAQQDELLGDYDWYQRGEIYGVNWDPSLPFWRLFNANAVRELAARIEPHDIVCLSTGWPQAEIAAAFPNRLVVEYGIGYEGCMNSTHHVFESYAWMHAVYGAQSGASSANGRFFDAVIPNFFDVDDFPQGAQDGGYFAFMSRMTERKGYGIAIDATRELGATLKIAGVGGDRPDHEHVEYLGFVDHEQRAELLGGARALFVPTLYLEPFGGVAVEAMLCGTPVITTDWGAFPELVRQGVDGFRCRTMGEFVAAAMHVGDLDSDAIRDNATARFSTDVVAEMYETHFERLASLWGDGFYADCSTRT